MYIINFSMNCISSKRSFVYHHCESFWYTLKRDDIQSWRTYEIQQWQNCHCWWYTIAFAMDKKIDLLSQVDFLVEATVRRFSPCVLVDRSACLPQCSQYPTHTYSAKKQRTTLFFYATYLLKLRILPPKTKKQFLRTAFLFGRGDNNVLRTFCARWPFRLLKSNAHSTQRTHTSLKNSVQHCFS